MRQIYGKAKQVIVWVGSEDDTTSLALTTMRNIFDSCCSLRYGYASHEEWLTNLQDDDGYWQSLRTDIVMKVFPQWPDDPKTCTNALQEFFQRPWFSRVWVIQEVQAFPNAMMQVGGTVIPWNIVASAATWVVYAPSSITHLNEPYKFGGFLHADLMRQCPFTTLTDIPFLELLDRCRAFQCTLSTDRIFALLQHPTARILLGRNEHEPPSKVIHHLGLDLDKQATHFGITVDYNLTLFDVYRQIVLGSITEIHSLQVLSHATEDAKYRENYPSWMPIWHAQDHHHNGPRRTFLYNASRGSEPQLSTFTDPMLLGLRGVVVGSVIETSNNIVLCSDRNALSSRNVSATVQPSKSYKNFLG